MSRSSHLELHHTESEALDLLGSDSLPSEPPDIRQWFPSYVYESPELDELDFQDSDGIGKTRVEEENSIKSGNNRRIGDYGIDCAGKSKPLDRIESNGCGDSESRKFVAVVSGVSQSLLFSEEPPDIRNWFPSYVYESPLLDTNYFAISVFEEMDDGKLDVEKSAIQNIKDPLASINVDKTELCAVKDTSDAVLKCPNKVKGTKLDYQSVCKDDDDDVTLQSLPSISILSSSNKATESMLSGQKAGYCNYKSSEKIGRANTHGNDFDAKLHTFSSRSPLSSSMENNIASQDGKSVYRPIKGTGRVKDGLGNEDINRIVSPRTTDRIVPKGDCRGSQADRRSIGAENEEAELQEDGFISVRKRRRQENAENVARPRIEVKPMINIDKDGNIVRKVLSEISNFQSQNIVRRTGKWSCPQKNKPDLGPPLKQLWLDQWVRRV